jgi:hypothetical protein
MTGCRQIVEEGKKPDKNALTLAHLGHLTAVSHLAGATIASLFGILSNEKFENLVEKMQLLNADGSFDEARADEILADLRKGKPVNGITTDDIVKAVIEGLPRSRPEFVEDLLTALHGTTSNPEKTAYLGPEIVLGIADVGSIPPDQKVALLTWALEAIAEGKQDSASLARLLNGAARLSTFDVPLGSPAQTLIDASLNSVVAALGSLEEKSSFLAALPKNLAGRTDPSLNDKVTDDRKRQLMRLAEDQRMSLVNKVKTR